MSLIRQLYPNVAAYPVELVEQRFAALQAAQEARLAEGKGSRRPDDWLAESALDQVLQEQARARDVQR